MFAYEEMFQVTGVMSDDLAKRVARMMLSPLLSV
jgi:hypothetical protein